MSYGLGSFEKDLKQQTQAFSGMSPPQLNQIANPTQKTRPDPNKGITPDLLKALAAQRLLKQKQAAENDLKASMEQDPRTVVQQQEEELQGLSLRETQSNVDKALANKQRQRGKTQNALNKLTPAQIAAMRNVSPSNPITRPLQNPRSAGIARAPVPKRIRSAQGGIVGYSNGGNVNDPYGIGALGELGIPRFDYSTNQDRTLVNLLKRILQGGMLKPENRNTPTNINPTVSNTINPFVPINTGESAKESLARRAAEKQQRGIDEQLNLLRQSQDSNVNKVEEKDSWLGRLLGLPDTRDVREGIAAGVEDFTGGPSFAPPNLTLAQPQDRLLSISPELLQAGPPSNKGLESLLGPNYNKKISELITEKDISGPPELVEPADGSELQPEIDTDGDDVVNKAINTEVSPNDEPRIVQDKIETYGSALDKLLFAASAKRLGDIPAKSQQYTQMILDRKNAAIELQIRRRSVEIQGEMVGVTREANKLDFYQRRLDTITKELAEGKQKLYETQLGIDLMAAETKFKAKEISRETFDLAQQAFDLKFTELYTDMYAEYDAIIKNLGKLGVDYTSLMQDTKENEKETKSDFNPVDKNVITP